MIPARRPRPDTLDERLLVIDPCAESFGDARVKDLPRYLRPGDLLVVNDAATLPASLRARGPSGTEVEVRFMGERTKGTWRGVLFGSGDWRTPTEHRSTPEEPVPGAGETDLKIDAGVTRHVIDGLFTGIHERGASHFSLLHAFAPLSLLENAYTHAETEGYLGHEFGDSNLILCQ